MDLLGIRKFVPDDLKFFKEYVQVYSHFANVLDILQGDKDIHVGALLPLLSGLMTKLEEESLKVEICSPLAKALIGGIKKRFEGEFSNDTLYIASAVHPRFKTLWIADPQQRAAVWELVRGELRGLQIPAETANESVSEPPATQSSNTSEGACIDEMDILVPLGTQTDTDDGTLLDVYMKQPTTKNLAVLDSFPLIKKLFIKRNTLLPSSASAEVNCCSFNSKLVLKSGFILQRLFSVGGNLFGKRRHSYTDKNFEMKLLLKTNTKYWR